MNMSKTPSKTAPVSNYFVPQGSKYFVRPLLSKSCVKLIRKCVLEIYSPNKDTPGISKTVYNHLANLCFLLNDWSSMRIKGVQICKSLSALRLHEFKDDYYPRQAKSLMDSLLQSLDGLKNIVDGTEKINKQMEALAKLQSSKEPVINTWSVSEISESIDTIYHTIEKELRLKQVITENIAHCRNENLIEVYASAWEFETYFNMETNAYLFAEVGLPIVI